MIIRVFDLAAPLSETEEGLFRRAAEKLKLSPNEISDLSVYRRSLDARRGRIRYVYTLDIELKNGVRAPRAPWIRPIEKEREYKIPRFSPPALRPVVVGFGPAGMFAGLLLARAGVRPLVIERGRRVEDRVRDTSHFFSVGELDPESNVQFGEGGAGTFSDGKLNTLLKDKNERGRFVLSEFVRFGAPREILFENKPHVGTDRLRTVVRNLREEILSLGGEVRFETKLTDLIQRNDALAAIRVLKGGETEEIACDTLFLGIGHSARDTFRLLRDCGVPMEKKVFSVGVRIEHPQSMIDRIQYSGAKDALLPPADYKLVAPLASGKRLYTFCMCPGGIVVPAASEEGGVVTNGMSNFDRGGENANSALLFSVDPGELPDDLFAGVRFQRDLERRAYLAGGGGFRAPAQLVGDLLEGRESKGARSVVPSYSRGVSFCDLAAVFDRAGIGILREGILGMDRRLKGFAHPDAVLTAVESRATSPVRILRGEDYQSEFSGLYPVGEGAGYAGGILSAAMDGMRAVEAYFERRRKK